MTLGAADPLVEDCGLDAVSWSANVADTTETLGQVIRAARLTARLRLRELARRLEKAPSYLSDIENDRRVPAEEVLRGFARELPTLDFEDLMARAGRFGSAAERYLRRSPAATTLFRRIQERNLNDDELHQLIDGLDKFGPKQRADD